MNLIHEFKQFALKGNVVDLAIGVVIGAAFGKIVSSLVDNILMPPIGLVVGGVDFSKLKIILKAAAADGKGEVAVNYGLFLQNSVDFIIIAFVLFLVIQAMNRLKSAPQDKASTPEDVILLREIRDSLKR